MIMKTNKTCPYGMSILPRHHCAFLQVIKLIDYYSGGVLAA